MTYTESANLMQDATFRGRVKTACLKFSQAIMIEASTVPAHNARYRWATQCSMNPDQTSTTVTPPTVLDPAVQDAGAQVTDTALQSAVEGVVNSMF